MNSIEQVAHCPHGQYRTGSTLRLVRTGNETARMAVSNRARLIVIATGVFLSVGLIGLHLNSLGSLDLKNYLPRPHGSIDHNKFREVLSDKWIVARVPAIAPSALEVLANIPGWRVVVVGDNMEQKNRVPSKCIYLSLDDQQASGLEPLKHFPVESSLGNTAGYLFAITHGAKVIYVPGNDVRLVDQLKTFIYDSATWGLMYNGNTFFNPYRHFGNPTLWPPGFPLSLTGDNLGANYGLNQWRTPSIQQAMVNGADAIFRVQKNGSQARGNVTFDGNAPPAFVKVGTFSPLDFQNTLYRYEALWALLLQTYIPSSMCGTCQGFWIQRLLWEIGRNVGFFPPNGIRQNPSPPSVVSKNTANNDADGFVKFLSRWRCHAQNSFFDCMVQLSKDMVLGKFMSKREKDLTAKVVSGLVSLGYHQPHRVPYGSLKHGAVVLEEGVLPNQTRLVSQMTNTTFWPANQTSPIDHMGLSSSAFLTRMLDINASCKNTSLTALKSVMPKNIRTFPNILLVIVFNGRHYGNIPFLEMLYRMHFPHIVYCGGQKSVYDKHTAHLHTMTYIEVDIGGGWFAQNCLVQAMKMNYKVDGYIYLGDDTLLNSWNIHNLPLDRLWLIEIDILWPTKKPNWMWFGMPNVGLKTYQNAIKASEYLDKPRFDRFFQMLEKNTGKAGGFYRTAADIAYVPNRLRDDTIYFLDHFSKFNFFVEMAFPTVFGGIENWKNWFEMPGMYLWYDGKREHIEKFFNKTKVFLHPVKISLEMKSLKGQKFFCETYFPLSLKGDSQIDPNLKETHTIV